MEARWQETVMSEKEMLGVMCGTLRIDDCRLVKLAQAEITWGIAFTAGQESERAKIVPAPEEASMSSMDWGEPAPITIQWVPGITAYQGPADNKPASESVREAVFDTICNVCESWDKKGHYCYLRYLKDTHPEECTLVGTVLTLIQPLIEKTVKQHLELNRILWE